MRGAGVHHAEVVLDGSAIVAPYDFGFQLRHYVVAPESREDEIHPIG